jgi:hypothetical protein
MLPIKSNSTDETELPYPTGLSGEGLVGAGQPRAKSPSALTHRRYGAVLFYITKIMQRPSPVNTQGDSYASVGDTPIAAAYQLVNSKTSKPLKY